MSASLPLCLCASLPLPSSLSSCLSISHSLSPCLCLCLSPSLFFCLYGSHSVCLSFCLPLSPPVFVSRVLFSFDLSFSLALSFSYSILFSIFCVLPPSVFLFPFFSIAKSLLVLPILFYLSDDMNSSSSKLSFTLCYWWSKVPGVKAEFSESSTYMSEIQAENVELFKRCKPSRRMLLRHDY